MTDELSSEQARRIFLKAQRLVGARSSHGSVVDVLSAVGAVQLDTISVLARSHELVPYARLGAIGKSPVEEAYWGHPPRAFEYWAHAACVLPLETWPYFSFRRRHYRDFDRSVRPELLAARAVVLDSLKLDGPLTVTELGGGRKGGPWWDWSDAKVAVELLLRDGDVVCLERRAFKRVYDLAERALPDELLSSDLADQECWTRLVAMAGARLGVATEADLADYWRLKRTQVAAGLEGSGLVPVRVHGWDDAGRARADGKKEAGPPRRALKEKAGSARRDRVTNAARARKDRRANAWADPGALEELHAGRVRGRHRTTLLSPFDSLVWDRARTERVFGFSHRLEAYVPRGKRLHGYFAMPLLAGGRLVGRVDPGRSGSTLVARQLSVEPAAVPAMAAALVEAAAWVGCTAVAVERTGSATVKRELRRELARLGA